jgi:hypothetical protein
VFLTTTHLEKMVVGLDVFGGNDEINSMSRGATAKHMHSGERGLPVEKGVSSSSPSTLLIKTNNAMTS